MDRPKLVFFFVLGVFFTVLVRHTIYSGNDFQVFHKTAVWFWEGTSIYDLSKAGEMVFKYPPWVFPIFAPLGLLSYFWGALIWGVIEVVSLIAIVKWVIARGVPSFWAYVFTAFFWGLWAVHALEGQIQLTATALALWGGGYLLGHSGEKGSWRKKSAALAMVFWALSTKVFAVIALLGLGRKNKNWAGAFGLAVLLSLPALAVTQGWNPVRLVQDWSEAASSGGSQMGAEKIRTRDNQGLPAAFLRAFSVPADDLSMDLMLALGIGVFLCFWWWRRSRGLPWDRSWAGWLALTAAIHPLSWFHSFVIVFPAACFSVWDSVQSKERLRILVSVLGFGFVAWVTRRTLGDLGAALELASIKSWGVLFLLWGIGRGKAG